MKNSIRKAIIIIICIIGFFVSYLLGDWVYINISLNSDFYSLGEIFFSIISLLISFSFIFALIFHIKIIQINKQDISNVKFENNLSRYPRKFIWFGNLIFGIAVMVLSTLIFKTTINNHINQNEGTLYYNYLISILIFIIGFIIINDAIRLKNRIVF